MLTNGLLPQLDLNVRLISHRLDGRRQMRCILLVFVKQELTLGDANVFHSRIICPSHRGIRESNWKYRVTFCPAK